MRSQTFELNLEPNIEPRLRALARAGVLFYNAALEQRRVQPGTLNRTRQMQNLGELYAQVKIEPLPQSVAHQLLLELDVVTFTPARYAERDSSHFYPLTWADGDIEIDKNNILLQPDFCLLLPDFHDPAGILTRVRVRMIISDITIVNFQWKAIPCTGPGMDRKRAFGYEGAEGSVDRYATMLSQIMDKGYTRAGLLRCVS